MQQSIKEFELINVDINSIELDPTNPNIMTKEQMAAMRKSMQQYGYLVPVILDRNNKICDGEHRVLIYKELGLSTIPAYKVDLDSDTDRKQLRQIMNKLHGFHDREKDAAELLEILQHSNDGTLQQLSELIAQPREDLERLVLRYNPGLEFVRPENQEEIDRLIDEEMQRISPNTQLGDLYQLGDHRIICADCTDKASMNRLLGSDQVAQLNCDPPYGVLYGNKNEVLNQMDQGNRIEEQYPNDQIDFDYRDMFNKVFSNIQWKDYNTIYIWSGDQHLHEIRQSMLDSNIRVANHLVWIKNNHVFSAGRKDYDSQHEYCLYGWKDRHKFYSNIPRITVLNYDKPLRNDLHPTMKPIELITQTITDGSQDGDVILDPFAGAGSSLIASEQCHRKWRGVEIDPHYVDVCIKRWEKYTGKTAVKLQ